MTPQDDVEVVRRGLDAWARRDEAAVESLTHPDGEWRPLLTAGGELERPVYRGRRGFVSYIRDMDELFDEVHVHVGRLDALGADQVLFEGRVVARGRASGVPLDTHIWALYELRDGKLFRGTAYRSREDAIAAAAEP